MSEDITARSVVELAVRVHGSKKLAYAIAAKQLGIAWETSRKIEVGDASGRRVPQEVVRRAFEMFRQQRLAQVRAEIWQLERFGEGELGVKFS
jgi:hypothetical protein